MKKRILVFLLLIFAFPMIFAQSPVCDLTRVTDPQGLNSDLNELFIDSLNCNCHDPTGTGNDTNYRSALDPQTPWCTPSALHEYRVNHKLFAGDTIYFRGGDYAVTDQSMGSTNYYHIGITTSGTANAPITFRPYPGENVTIRGSSMSFKKIIASSASYLIFDGMNFVGYVDGPDGRLYIPYLMEFGNSQGVQIKNASFGPVQGNDDSGYPRRTGAGSQASAGGIYFWGVTSAALDNITVSCTDGPDKLTGRVGSLSADGVQFNSSQNVTVTNSRFLDCGHVSLTIRNVTNALVEKNEFNNRFHTSLGILTITQNQGLTADNIVRHNRFFGVNQFPSENTLKGGHIQLGPGGMTNTKIYNNLIYNGYNDSTGIGVGNNPLQDPITTNNDNTQIFNNTLYQAGIRGINIGNNVNAGQNTVTNTKVFNNIIAYSKINEPATTNTNPKYEIAVNQYYFVQNNGYGSQFKNNLIVTIRPDGNIVYIRDPDNQNTTIYDAPTFDATSFADNTVNTDPLFVNESANDFHLQSNSPAINAATCISDITNDYDNITRTAGGGCTIGAFEYDPAAPPSAVCGNEIIEATETCDGTNLNGKTCLTLDYNNGTLSCNSNCTFNTTACSNQPTPQCSDGTDNDSDNKTDYPTDPDCQSTTDNTETPITTCTENWACTEWSTCFNGFQIRTCTDENHCGTILNTPITNQTCSTDNDQNQDTNSNQNDNNPNNPPQLSPLPNDQNQILDQNQLATQPNGLLDTTKIVLIAFAVLIVLGATLTAIKSMTDV